MQRRWRSAYTAAKILFRCGNKMHLLPELCAVILFSTVSAVPLAADAASQKVNVFFPGICVENPLLYCLRSVSRSGRCNARLGVERERILPRNLCNNHLSLLSPQRLSQRTLPRKARPRDRRSIL